MKLTEAQRDYLVAQAAAGDAACIAVLRNLQREFENAKRGVVRTFYRGRDMFVLDQGVVAAAVAGFKGEVRKVEAGVASGAYRARRGGAMPMRYYAQSGVGA